MSLKITGIEIENFKIFKENTHLDIRPLTILTGTNNSGKSSVLDLLRILHEAFNEKNENIFKMSWGNFMEKIQKLGRLSISPGLLRNRYGNFTNLLNRFSTIKDSLFISFSIQHKNHDVIIKYCLRLKSNELLVFSTIDIIDKNTEEKIYHYNFTNGTYNINFNYFYLKNIQDSFEVRKIFGNLKDILNNISQLKNENSNIALLNLKNKISIGHIDRMFYSDLFFLKENACNEKDAFLNKLGSYLNDIKFDYFSFSDLGDSPLLLPSTLPYFYNKKEYVFYPALGYMHDWNELTDYCITKDNEKYPLEAICYEIIENHYSKSNSQDNLNHFWQEYFHFASTVVWGGLEGLNRPTLFSELISEDDKNRRQRFSFFDLINYTIFNDGFGERSFAINIYNDETLDFDTFRNKVFENIESGSNKIFDTIPEVERNSIFFNEVFLPIAFEIFINKIYPYEKINIVNLSNGIDNRKHFIDQKDFNISLYEKNFYTEIYEIVDLINNINSSLQSLKNIGSSRINPSRYFSMDDSKNFGFYLNEISIISQKLEVRSFIEKWMRIFQIGDQYKIVQLEDTELCKLIIVKAGIEESITDFGFGINQLFPIIIGLIPHFYKVQEYQNNRNTDPYHFIKSQLVLIEEPESHLHPALQSKLADMFMDAINTFQVRLIIETHSEYLIRKLQYLCAKQDSGVNKEDILIHYFTNAGDGEKVRQITIDDFGALSEDFGTGFFDEADKIAMSLWSLNNAQKN